MKASYHLLLWPTLGVVTLDQISKQVVMDHLAPHRVVEVIPGFFNLVLVRNRGIAFGLLNQDSGQLVSYLLMGIAVIAILFLVGWVFGTKEPRPLFVLSIALILGGAIGNLIDRVRLGSVMDFLDFHVGTYHWPAFNVADSAITIGTLSLAYFLLFKARA